MRYLSKCCFICIYSKWTWWIQDCKQLKEKMSNLDDWDEMVDEQIH